MAEYNWPSPDEFGETETIDAEILVLGGGLAGCFAAIAVARKGEKVVLVEKGATKRSRGWRGYNNCECIIVGII